MENKLNILKSIIVGAILTFVFIVALLGASYLLSLWGSGDRILADLRQDQTNVRMHAFEKRLGELDVRIDALASALREQEWHSRQSARDR